MPVQVTTPYDLVQALARVLTTSQELLHEPVERTKLLRGAVKGMVSELDPHSVYMTTEEWKDAQDGIQGHFAGVGVEVDLRGDAITVIAPIEGSPAERAGIKGATASSPSTTSWWLRPRSRRP